MQAGTAGAADLQTILPAAGEQQRQAGGRACPSPVQTGVQTGARRALPCGFSARSAGTAEAEAPGAASSGSWNLKRVSVPFTAPAGTGACLRRPATDLGAPAGTCALARHPRIRWQLVLRMRGIYLPCMHGGSAWQG